MKKMSVLGIAVTFAGCFLGAGYVSGQEIWQFFVSFGKKGLFGLAAAMGLLFLFGFLLMRLVSLSGLSECDALVVRNGNKWAMAFFGIAETFFLFGIAVIMTAGVGALFHQLFNQPSWIASAVFSILLYVLILGGVERMIQVFSFTVPFLVIVTLMVCSICISRLGLPEFSSVPLAFVNNPLLSDWRLSAVTFVSYNLFSAVGVLAPVGRMITSRRKTIAGLLIGTVFLLLIALGVFSALVLCPYAVGDPLPMLTVAGHLSTFLGYVYAVLLLFGMMGTGVSSLVAILNYFKVRFTFYRADSCLTPALLCCFTFAGSLLGFGELIGVVYPLCGYLGMIALCCLAEHYVHLRQAKKRRNERL